MTICRFCFCFCLLAWSLFVLLVVQPVAADEFPAEFDLARCGGSPPEGVSVSTVGGVLRCVIRSETATARCLPVSYERLTTMIEMLRQAQSILDPQEIECSQGRWDVWQSHQVALQQLSNLGGAGTS